MQEEELDSCRAARRVEAGGRDEGAGRNQHGLSLPRSMAKKEGGRFATLFSQAAFAFGLALLSSFALDLAANSAFTFCVIASVSTL